VCVCVCVCVYVCELCVRVHVRVCVCVTPSAQQARKIKEFFREYAVRNDKIDEVLTATSRVICISNMSYVNIYLYINHT